MEHLTDKIQDYIEGHLTGNDMLEFENHMQADADFRNLVTLHQEVHAILHKRVHRDEQGLREVLKAEEQKHRHQQPIVRFKNIKIWMTGLAAAIVLLFGTLFFLNNRNDLYALPELTSEIVRGEEANTNFEKAVQLFNQKSYSESRQLLQDLLEEEPAQVQWQYYAALTHYGEGHWEKAFTALTPIADGESVFANEAKYYQAVTLLKQNEQDKALTLLNQIDDQGALGRQVKALKEKIK